MLIRRHLRLGLPLDGACRVVVHSSALYWKQGPAPRQFYIVGVAEQNP